MPLKSKDTIGFALAACTVVLLVLHGREPHQAGTPGVIGVGAGVPEGEGMASSAAAIVAFVDVHLPGTSDASLEESEESIVVVRHGVVSEIGSAKTVRLPPDALVVDGDGSAYLVAAPSSGASESTWRPVMHGGSTELVLYAVDPRSGSKRAPIKGRLVGGRWTPSGGTARTPGVPAGH